MYYLSKIYSEDEYGIIDTSDMVECRYTKEQVKDIVANQKEKVYGVFISDDKEEFVSVSPVKEHDRHAFDRILNIWKHEDTIYSHFAVENYFWSLKIGTMINVSGVHYPQSAYNPVAYHASYTKLSETMWHCEDNKYGDKRNNFTFEEMWYDFEYNTVRNEVFGIVE